MTDGSVVLAVLRLLVSLAVVLVLLVMLARWASRRGLGSARPGRSTVEVEVLSRRSLGKASTLQVVKVGSQVMVLGVTDRGVTVLGELGEEDLVPAAAPLSVVRSVLPAGVASIVPSEPLPVPFPVAAADAAAEPAVPVLPRSSTWAEAENRALVAAGMQTRSGARAARQASQGHRTRRLHLPLTGQPRQLRQPGLPGQPRQSRTNVPTVDSRSSRRAAQAPSGWPWNAAALVLGAAGRSRRG